MERESRDDLSWKDKYLNNLEENDAREKDFKLWIDVLRRGLLRVSVAADGVDHNLDQRLGHLREALRGESSTQRIESLVGNIDDAVRQLDDRRKSGHDALLNALEHLTEYLLSLTPPRPIKKDLKLLSRRIMSDDLFDLEVQANLLDQYGALQQGTVENLLPEQDENTKKSFWQRLMPGDQEPSGDAEDTVGGQIGRVEEHNDASDIFTAEFVEIRERVAGVLLAMLDQIQTPDRYLERENEIRSRLRQGFTLQNFPETLSEAIALMTGSRLEIEKEFEAFLLSMNGRLEEVQLFLDKSREAEEHNLSSSDALDSKVRDTIEGISSTMDEAKDLGDLKSRVQSKLSGILSNMDTFKANTAERKDTLFSEIRRLSERMEAMESEANKLRHDVAQQREEAMKDALTQLPNRQAYMDHLDKVFARQQRYGGCFSLCVCDVDNFKKINDEYGHLAGDKVLKVVAKEIANRVRSADFVSRYGGEEFVIIMPETDGDSAMVAIDHIRKSVEECPFHFKEQRVPITISFGVADYKEDDTQESLFSKADKALYAAKHRGKNCVVKAGDEDAG